MATANVSTGRGQEAESGGTALAQQLDGRVRRSDRRLQRGEFFLQRKPLLLIGALRAELVQLRLDLVDARLQLALELRRPSLDEDLGERVRKPGRSFR